MNLCSKEKNKKLAIIAAALVVVFVLWRGNGVYTPSRPRPAGKAGPTLKLATWNIAAINNNPFEYVIYLFCFFRRGKRSGILPLATYSKRYARNKMHLSTGRWLLPQM